jgi:hypothetical protein
MEKPLIIEDESAWIWLEDGVIHFKYKQGIIVNLETQKKILRTGIHCPTEFPVRYLRMPGA